MRMAALALNEGDIISTARLPIASRLPRTEPRGRWDLQKHHIAEGSCSTCPGPSRAGRDESRGSFGFSLSGQAKLHECAISTSVRFLGMPGEVGNGALSPSTFPPLCIGCKYTLAFISHNVYFEYYNHLYLGLGQCTNLVTQTAIFAYSAAQGVSSKAHKASSGSGTVGGGCERRVPRPSVQISCVNPSSGMLWMPRRM